MYDDKAFDKVLLSDLEKAKSAYSLASYLGECATNAGLRKIWSNRAAWLSSVIYLAELAVSSDVV